MLSNPREPFAPGEDGNVLSRFTETGSIQTADVTGAVHQNLHVLAHLEGATAPLSTTFKLCAN
jgi:hypothetical protein